MDKRIWSVCGFFPLQLLICIHLNYIGTHADGIDQVNYTASHGSGTALNTTGNMEADRGESRRKTQHNEITTLTDGNTLDPQYDKTNKSTDRYAGGKKYPVHNDNATTAGRITSTLFHNGNDISYFTSSTILTTPGSLSTSTLRRIYHRGRLVNKHAHLKFNESLKSVGESKVLDFREPKTNSPKRQKRKHRQPSSSIFHNYKLLHNTVQREDLSIDNPIGYYTWIFGGGMVAVGCLTTLTSIIVFCYCKDKVKKKREARRRHQMDGAGEYHRVESVSSIVDHINHPGIYEDEDEEAMENISMI